MDDFEKKIAELRKRHEALLTLKNESLGEENGIYEKYVNPILTAAHTPLE